MASFAATKIIILAAVGLTVLTTGLMFKRFLQWHIEENLILSPEAEPYKYWKVVPVPIYSRFYFFNITNSKDIVEHNEKPLLEELGPYTFRETREKINITWHPNGTVSYYQIKRWYFEPELTNGSLDDLVTTLNVPLVTAIHLGISSGDEHYLDKIIAFLHHFHSEVFVTKPVSSLLFDGYEEEIITHAVIMDIFFPHDKFGWFYGKNNSHDGIYNIYTGRTNVNKYGYVDRWNGNRLVSGRHYPCNIIDGTAGDMWPPFRQGKEQKLPLFTPDICSTLHLSFLEVAEVNEIVVYRYWLDETALNRGNFEKENSCQGKDFCAPHGALDIEECQHGAPAVVSYPHFLYAPLYLAKVDGLRPDPEFHKFIIDLETDLGIPVNVNAQLQMNVALPKCDRMEELEFLNETIYYPIFWFSESTSINLDTAEKIKFVTERLPEYVGVGSFLTAMSGYLLLVRSLRLAVRHRRKHKKSAHRKTTDNQHNERRPLLPVQKPEIITEFCSTV